MDIQETINAHMALARKKSLAQSDQLTLGELILKLEPILSRCKSDEVKELPTVVFDFGYFRPTQIDSWRGAYEELALNYTEDNECLDLQQMLNLLNGAIGKTFCGYKGGDFYMSKNTPVWVANYGNSGSTAVIDVLDNKYQVVIITGYREY